MAEIKKYKCIDKAIPYNWGKLKPVTKWERREVLKKGGPQCFLIPEKLKFPVCNKTDACLNCHGLLTAYRRARQYKYPEEVWMKAIKLAKEAGCDWVEKTIKKLPEHLRKSLEIKKVAGLEGKVKFKKIGKNRYIKIIE